MKKKKWIAVLLIFGLLAVLFTPIPAGELRDGGTKVYRALTYTLVNWHRVCAEPDGIYEALRVYPFPDSMRTVSDLWELEQSRVPDLRETEFCAQIKEINGTSILVEGQENTGSAFRGEIVLSISEETVIQSEQKSLSIDALQVGDRIRVTCGGESLTIYPPIMPYIYRVEVIDPVPESIFVHRDSYPAKAIRVDSTGDHGSFLSKFMQMNSIPSKEQEYGLAMHFTAPEPWNQLLQEMAQSDSFWDIHQAWDAECALARVAAQYDESFFHQNTLLVLYISEGSGSIRHKINNLKIENNRADVFVERLVPEVGTDDMAGWFLLLELPAEWTDEHTEFKIKVQ